MNLLIGSAKYKKFWAEKKLVFGYTLFFAYCAYFFFHFSGTVSPRLLESIILILGFVYFFVYGKDKKKSLAVFYGVLFCFFVVISWYFISKDYPEYDHDLISIRGVLGYLMFIPLAFLIKGNIKLSVIVFLSFVAGFLVSPWFGGSGFEYFEKGFAGQRVRFGTNPILDGIMASVVIIFLVSFSRWILQNLQFKYGAICFLLIAVIVAYCLSIIYVTQSRSAYVAAIATCMFSVSILIKKNPKIFFGFKGFFVLFLNVLVVFLVVCFSLDSGIFDKSAREMESVFKLLSFEWSNAPDTSWGYRLQMASLGIEFSLQRPFLGWGNSGGHFIMELSGFHGEKRIDFPHLHNSYIEMLVRYGYLFLFSSLVFFGYVFYRIFKFYLIDFRDSWFFCFLVLSLFFIFFVSNFDAVIFHSDTSRLFGLMVAIALSHVWFPKNES